ncbi:hypothetical protein [Lachnoclostridium phytofermentans]|uniref:Lipoprotein n=1 Tax=Lachnoclostridium phytofermentans (strain ATCC 700394 / DSM 18823 / ISDg) TaxID=357809 RepID=A9KNP5_LACP7|nr:hypothetical protein [Lachnoclostridium phytofermentans]ABX41646.1 hypothetical protein Cphy_1268 [Lachnoclostridium phytofermentans ISDg]
MNKRFYKFVLIILALLSTSMIGCSSKNKNTVMNIGLTEREKVIASFSGDMFAELNFEFGNDIGGQALYLEEWIKGEKTNSYTISYGGTSETYGLYINSNTIKNDYSAWEGVEWNLMTDAQGLRTLLNPRYFQFPDNTTFDFRSQSVIGDSQKDKMKLESGKEYILAARFFYLSVNGIKDIQCESIAEQEDLLKNIDYAVLLRLALYNTEEEAERLNQ